MRAHGTREGKCDTQGLAETTEKWTRERRVDQQVLPPDPGGEEQWPVGQTWPATCFCQ